METIQDKIESNKEIHSLNKTQTEIKLEIKSHKMLKYSEVNLSSILKKTWEREFQVLKAR